MLRKKPSTFDALVAELKQGDFATEAVKNWRMDVCAAFNEIAVALKHVSGLRQASVEKIQALVLAKLEENPSLAGNCRAVNRSNFQPSSLICEMLVGPKGEQWLIRAHLGTNSGIPVDIYVRKNIKPRRTKKK